MKILALRSASHFNSWELRAPLLTLTVCLLLQPSGRSQAVAAASQPGTANTTLAGPAAASPIQLSPEELGDLHLARRRFQAAIESYRQIPVKTALIWNKVGMANQQLLSNSEARKSYQNALKLDPKNPDILNNMGTIYYSMKDYGNAEKYYRKALKLNPKSALVYKNLGTVLLAENKFRKGWDCYQTALSIEPDIFERSYPYRIGEPTPPQKRGAMNYYLALSYARVGNSNRAVDYLRMAINEGFTDRRKVMADKEFAVLRGNEAFDQLIAESSRQ